MCYIETSNLDGETNLKIRQVSSAIISQLLLSAVYLRTSNCLRVVLSNYSCFLFEPL